ncbi:hypothetical protein BCR35DRAFT_308452 [Leucosporidium creatinivorum]|uniref:Uncharacterized protein n=1 Tax=Leucosporidium creatinivorum TaxID=106004 RepID=A0A1Y2E5K2_9BASI|nr:hypothetical protein BCR35DRAFT_308452 [Leucosporidium creatinivorum]
MERPFSLPCFSVRGSLGDDPSAPLSSTSDLIPLLSLLLPSLTKLGGAETVNLSHCSFSAAAMAVKGETERRGFESVG